MPEFSEIYLVVLERKHYVKAMNALTIDNNLPSRLLAMTDDGPHEVWTPRDFFGLGKSATVYKALQRLVVKGQLRRICRGLYDRPCKNKLTGRVGVPDYHDAIRAVVRRGNLLVLAEGMTAANEIGLTEAVPAHIEVLVNARIKPLRIGNQTIFFRFVTGRRLCWANRPGMRVVQGLGSMREILAQSDNRMCVQVRLKSIFNNPERGQAIRDDLQQGLSTLPTWMQEFLRELLGGPDVNRCLA